MKYFEFQVSLREVRPRIWRKFLLHAEGTTFLHLHLAIQAACGWGNCHLFAFRRSGRDRETIAGIPDESGWALGGPPTPDAMEILLDSYFGLQKAKSCNYEYDFGDGWIHEVKLVREVAQSRWFVRQLTAGARAFPPEDCGGIGGYWECVQFLKTGENSRGLEPEEFRRWLGNWQPEAFDLETVKAGFDLPQPRTAKAPKPKAATTAKRAKKKAPRKD